MLKETPPIALSSTVDASAYSKTSTPDNFKTEVDHTLYPPNTHTHHKAPLVHAHFYVDETFKSKLNSRSGSLTAMDNPSSQPPASASLASSTDKLQGRTANLSPQASRLSAADKPAPALPTVPAPTSEVQANIDPRLPQDDDRLHVLLGVCGALSTAKIKLIINKLYEIYTPRRIAIQLILTLASEHFLAPETLSHLENTKKVRVWRDSDEWTTWKSRSDPVLHIELRRWADILIVCPLTANTLAKIAMGICDNLLTNVIRAWNTSYPILLAPSMVSHAYNAATTKRQLKLIALEMQWIEILKPVEKIVGSYGDIGMGGMMDWNEIVNKIVLRLGGYPDDEDEDAADDDDGNENEEAIADDDEDDDEDDDDEDDDDDDEEEEVENVTRIAPSTDRARTPASPPTIPLSSSSIAPSQPHTAA